MATVQMWIDEYDDIFSDFDPRPYEVRTISNDFWDELNKLYTEHPDDIDVVKILVPVKMQQRSTEKIIAKRVTAYITMRANVAKKKLRKIYLQSSSMLLLGIGFMLIATWLDAHHGVFWLSFLRIVAEPAGWFCFWESLNLFIFEKPATSQAVARYNELAKAKIMFKPYTAEFERKSHI